MKTLIVLIAARGAVFPYVVGIDALEERNAFQFFADSPPYQVNVSGGLDRRAAGRAVGGIAADLLGPPLVLFGRGETDYPLLAPTKLRRARARPLGSG